jgi:hypothetical protein
VNRFILFTALACAALAPSIHPAVAQPAMALGQPLPDGSMTAGTVTVRVIAGTPAAAVAGADVTLTVNGQPRTAKSDGSGRATFRDVPVGAQVQATIIDEQQKPQTSTTFAVPPAGGTRLMLSTKPFTGAPASHNLGAGARAPQGAPEARAMSGQPRPDRMVEPGSYQIRLTYNNLTVQDGAANDDKPPAGEPVTLVGYRSDGTVDVRTQPVGADGRTTFKSLDVSGHTNYFAMARLPRAGGTDRLVATAMAPDTQVGAKLILSSAKRDSTSEPIDEAMGAQAIPTPAGKVRVTLEGVPTMAPISLVDATTKSVLATTTPEPGAPDPRNIQGEAPFEAAPDLPVGTVAVRVHGGPGSTDAGLPDVPVRIIPADQDNAEGVSSKTGPDGIVQLQAPSDKPQKAVMNVNGKDLVSAPFELSKSGGRLDVYVHWEQKGRPEVLFDVPYRPELVLYAETRATLPGGSREELFRSRPIQLSPSNGVHLPISILPRVVINFSKRADIEDQLLYVRGTYTLQNLSWMPYSAGPDGMVIPLPKGFKGGKIADEHQNIASIAPGEGVRIVRPLEPGRTQFLVGYSLVSEDGNIDWNLDIKQDLYQAGMEIRLFDGMVVKPRGAQGRTAAAPNGSQWFVIDDINIRAGQSMAMKITGMPSPPAWKIWLPRLVGLLAFAVLVAGVAFALVRRPQPAAPAGHKRRAALLDELVELERTGKDPARREQALAELERLWRE